VVLALPDASIDVEDATAQRARWSDWLQWSNVVQFMKSPGRDAVIITSTSPNEDLFAQLFVTAAAEGQPVLAPAAPVSVALTEEQREELELVEPDSVRELLEDVLKLGAPWCAIGYESDDGTPLEVAWPEHQIAIVADGISSEGLEDWIIYLPASSDAAEINGRLRGDS